MSLTTEFQCLLLLRTWQIHVKIDSNLFSERFHWNTPVIYNFIIVNVDIFKIHAVLFFGFLWKFEACYVASAFVALLHHTKGSTLDFFASFTMTSNESLIEIHSKNLKHYQRKRKTLTLTNCTTYNWHIIQNNKKILCSVSELPSDQQTDL